MEISGLAFKRHAGKEFFKKKRNRTEKKLNLASASGTWQRTKLTREGVI